MENIHSLHRRLRDIYDGLMSPMNPEDYDTQMMNLRALLDEIEIEIENEDIYWNSLYESSFDPHESP